MKKQTAGRDLLGDLAPVPTLRLYWGILLYRASILFITVLFALKVLVKRLADAGKNVYYAWFMGIPYFNLIFALYMCFVRTNYNNYHSPEK